MEAESHLRRWLEFRSRLVPYTYAEAWRVTAAGGTLMRPLVFDFPGDPAALDCADQFMFGPAFLVSPVLASGAPAREVLLPAGSDWVDFWTGERLAGGRAVSVPVPLDRIPLHVRAGSIVPLGPVRQYVDEMPADPIELRIYPGADARLAFYEDDGVSHGYERGEHAVIPISWDDATATLALGTREGTFPGVPVARTFRVVLVRPGHGVGTEPAPTADLTVRYDGAAWQAGL
jgi:alpha-D-xyloside xylohydrolase